MCKWWQNMSGKPLTYLGNGCLGIGKTTDNVGGDLGQSFWQIRKENLLPSDGSTCTALYPQILIRLGSVYRKVVEGFRKFSEIWAQPEVYLICAWVLLKFTLTCKLNKIQWRHSCGEDGNDCHKRKILIVKSAKLHFQGDPIRCLCKYVMNIYGFNA